MSIFASVMQQTKPLYEILEYIQSTGTQYIECLRSEVQDCIFKCDISYDSFYADDYDWFIGSRLKNENWLAGVYNGKACFWRSGYYYAGSLPAGQRTVLTVDLYNHKFTSSAGTATALASQFGTLSNPALLFWGNAYSFEKSPKCRCYGVKHYHIDELISDYVPVMRISDGAIGLYDKVTREFVASKTSTPFVAGPKTGDTIGTTISKPTLVTREVAALVARGEKAINRNMSKVYRTVNGVVRQVFPDVLAVRKFIDGPRISDNLQFMLSGDGSGGRTPGAHSSVGNGIRISHNQCGGSMFITTEKVNVSNYSKLSARAIAYVNNSRMSMDFCVMLFTSMPADLNRRTFYSYYNWYFTGVGGTKLVEAASELIYPYNVGVPCSAMLDLSKIYGEYYIALEVVNNHNGSGNGSITIDSFMLE